MARTQESPPESGAGERGLRPPSPTLVVVGGVDPGGGAGLLRDVATAAALGARAHAIGTAWTEQTDGVHRVEPRDPEAVRAALARALADLAPDAVKIGMAVGPETARALMAGLAGFGGPVVVDPVLATSRGGALWGAEPAAMLPLLRRATLVTPNASEAAALTARAVATGPDAVAAGSALVGELSLAAVLVKGGHLQETDRCVTDVLITPDAATYFTRPRLPGLSPRGTGCALATAVAVALGRGQHLVEAIQTATTWLAAAIEAARTVGGERHLGSVQGRI